MQLILRSKEKKNRLQRWWKRIKERRAWGAIKMRSERTSFYCLTTQFQENQRNKGRRNKWVELIPIERIWSQFSAWVSGLGRDQKRRRKSWKVCTEDSSITDVKEFTRHRPSKRNGREKRRKRNREQWIRVNTGDKILLIGLCHYSIQWRRWSPFPLFCPLYSLTDCTFMEFHE